MPYYLAILCLLASSQALAGESVCFGTTTDGRLEGGVKLESSGNNFTGYSASGELLGRTYVHSKVKDIISASYQWLETQSPGKVYKFAESGFKEGGRFRPHKTHRNGLSVDFMVPVVNGEGESVHLPTNVFNKFGYAIEFDEAGKYEEYTIDYEAMAAHLVSLHQAAVARGANLWRVIFDPKLQPHLLNTKYGPYPKENIQFSQKKSWVRHDEHYHVDFDIPCRKL